MAAAFEAAEPDDLLPVSLPIDDIARRGATKAGKEFVEAVGQKHHVLSNKIVDALSAHPTLNGLLKRDDFLVQGIDGASHRGYQEWHRQYDGQVVKWLSDNPAATRKEFLEYLMGVYKDSDMDQRFPDAWMLLQMALEELE